jgi:hypothetical protein
LAKVLLVASIVACKPAEPPPVVAAPVPTPSAAVPDAAPPPVSSTPPPDPPRDPIVHDVKAWFEARGSRPPESLETLGNCREAKVGAPLRDALICDHGAPLEVLPGGPSTFPLYILTVEKKSASFALKIPVSAGPLDRIDLDMPDDPDDGMYVVLDWSLVASGTQLVVRQRANQTCAKALAEFKDASLAQLRRAVQKACASIGTWEWKDKAFVKP